MNGYCKKIDNKTPTITDFTCSNSETNACLKEAIDICNTQTSNTFKYLYYYKSGGTRKVMCALDTCDEYDHTETSWHLVRVSYT